MIDPSKGFAQTQEMYEHKPASPNKTTPTVSCVNLPDRFYDSSYVRSSVAAGVWMSARRGIQKGRCSNEEDRICQVRRVKKGPAASFACCCISCSVRTTHLEGIRELRKGRGRERKGGAMHMTTLSSMKGIPFSEPCISTGKTESAENESDSHLHTY
jgi:hypothetical protein